MNKLARILLIDDALKHVNDEELQPDSVYQLDVIPTLFINYLTNPSDETKYILVSALNQTWSYHGIHIPVNVTPVETLLSTISNSTDVTKKIKALDTASDIFYKTLEKQIIKLVQERKADPKAAGHFIAQVHESHSKTKYALAKALQNFQEINLPLLSPEPTLPKLTPKEQTSLDVERMLGALDVYSPEQEIQNVTRSTLNEDFLSGYYGLGQIDLIDKQPRMNNVMAHLLENEILDTAPPSIRGLAPLNPQLIYSQYIKDLIEAESAIKNNNLEEYFKEKK